MTSWFAEPPEPPARLLTPPPFPPACLLTPPPFEHKPPSQREPERLPAASRGQPAVAVADEGEGRFQSLLSSLGAEHERVCAEQRRLQLLLGLVPRMPAADQEVPDISGVCADFGGGPGLPFAASSTIPVADDVSEGPCNEAPLRAEMSVGDRSVTEDKTLRSCADCSPSVSPTSKAMDRTTLPTTLPLGEFATGGSAVFFRRQPGWPSTLASRLADVPEGSRRQARCSDYRAIVDSGQPHDLNDSRRVAGVPMRVFKMLVLHPTSHVRMTFDVMSIVLLSFDLVVTPFVTAWQMPTTGELQILQWCALCFWPVDMILSFRTGFYEAGELRMNPQGIARHYVSSFFVLDAIAVLSDWVPFLLTLVNSSTVSVDNLKVARFVKLTRMLRILGLLRMARRCLVIVELLDRCGSDTIITIMQVFQLFCCIVWVNHIAGCVWFAVGRYAHSDTGARWTDVFFEDNGGDGAAYGAGFSFQYFTALHWSLSQITPGSMEVTPRNTAERQFNVICLCCGLLFASSLVSSMSASMMHLRMLKQGQMKSIAKLRQFLRQSGVDADVAVRVQKQAVDRLAYKSRVTMKDVDALHLLSPSLLAHLKTNMFERHLYTNPVFRLVGQVHAATMQKINCEVASMALWSQDDDLFSPDEEAPAVYYLVTGTLEYRQEPEFAPVDETVVEKVVKGAWFCEATLWVHWTHVGTMVALTPSELVQMHAAPLLSVLCKHFMVSALIRTYGECFQNCVASAGPPFSEWPSDLRVPCTDHGEMVSSMSIDVRSTIGSMALSQLALKTPWMLSSLGVSDVNLRGEVESGTCTLVQNGAGEIERVVFVMVLQLHRESDGHILARLGRRDGHGGVRPGCTLPGTKRRDEETFKESFDRLLEDELPYVAKGVRLTRVQRETKVSDSSRLKVRTKYMKTVQHGVIADAEATMPDWCRREVSEENNRFLGRDLPSSVYVQGAMRAVSPHEDSHTSREFVHAWLSPQEFDHMSSAGGEKDLGKMLEAVDFEKLVVRSSIPGTDR